MGQTLIFDPGEPGFITQSWQIFGKTRQSGKKSTMVGPEIWQDLLRISAFPLIFATLAGNKAAAKAKRCQVHFDIGEYRVAISMPDRAGLLREIARRFEAGEGFALATVNLDHLVKLRHPGAFRKAYAAQDLVVADGNPLVWMSKLAGDPVELIPGADMVVPLSELAARHGVPVGLVGSTEEALQGAEEALCKEIPDLKVAARIAPPMGFDPDGPGGDAVFAQLRDSGARMVFLALGAPKQEILAARGRMVTPEIGYASIGAGLDFLAGTQTRAPAVIRALALEWLWRMMSNPGRLGLRYTKCMAILPGQVLGALRQRIG